MNYVLLLTWLNGQSLLLLTCMHPEVLVGHRRRMRVRAICYIRVSRHPKCVESGRAREVERLKTLMYREQRPR